MKIMGDLIDVLLKSNAKWKVYLESSIEKTDSISLTFFRDEPIGVETVSYFCFAIIDEVKIRLAGISSESLYMIVKKEGVEFLHAVWSHVEAHGIPPEAVLIPITASDWMERIGSVDVTNGVVSLTPEGDRAADAIEQAIKDQRDSE